MLDNDLECGDLIRASSWGFTSTNPNKPVLFDYGLNHSVWSECYILHKIPVHYENKPMRFNIVETIEDSIKNLFVDTFVNGRKVRLEKVVVV